MLCVSLCNLSFVWNGEKLESFTTSRALRQRDALSPYLFVLCIKKLALLIAYQVGDGSWLPVKVSRIRPVISHLFFMDDCHLFTKAKASQVCLVSQVLDDFCWASILKVNLEKSKFMCSKNANQRWRNSLALPP